MARVRCMAMSANDLHLAVWLDTGIMYLIDLTTQKIIGKLDIKPRPPESAVHCLSFPANGNELVITIRTGEMVEIYSYPVLGGPSSHRLTWPLSKVCQMRIHSILFAALHFSILMNSYSTKAMTKASLQVFTVRRRGCIALRFGQTVVSLSCTTGPEKNPRSGTGN